jgi:hypothetical protein
MNEWANPYYSPPGFWGGVSYWVDRLVSEHLKKLNEVKSSSVVLPSLKFQEHFYPST